MKHPPCEECSRILRLCAEENCIESVSRQTGISRALVLRPLGKQGHDCMAYHDRAVCCIRARRARQDEVWLLDCCKQDDPQKSDTEHGHTLGLQAVILVMACCALIGPALLYGTQIRSRVAVPGYATVYVDMPTHTYFAPQCFQAGRPGLIPTSLSEAETVGFSMDEGCRQTGAFSQEGPSLTGRFFQKIGIRRPQKYWWAVARDSR